MIGRALRRLLGGDPDDARDLELCRSTALVLEIVHADGASGPLLLRSSLAALAWQHGGRPGVRSVLLADVDTDDGARLVLRLERVGEQRAELYLGGAA